MLVLLLRCMRVPDTIANIIFHISWLFVTDPVSLSCCWVVVVSLTRKKLPNVYKSFPKMISLEKLKILTPLQKLPKNVGDLSKISSQRLWKVAQSPINLPIWSHWWYLANRLTVTVVVKKRDQSNYFIFLQRPLNLVKLRNHGWDPCSSG